MSMVRIGVRNLWRSKLRLILVAALIGRPEARRLKEELGTQPRVYYLT